MRRTIGSAKKAACAHTRARLRRSRCTQQQMGGAERAACAHARAHDLDAAGAHGRQWEVPKRPRVRMRARWITTQTAHTATNGKCRKGCTCACARAIWTQLAHTTTMGGAEKAACAHARARSGRTGATGKPHNHLPRRTV